MLDAPFVDGELPADHPDVAMPDVAVPDDGGVDDAGCDDVGAVETCNGRDDDCDGTIDDGCACRPMTPVTVGDGFHLGVAITDAGEIITARQDFSLGSSSVEAHGADFAVLGDAADLVLDAARPQNDLRLFALGDDVGGIWRMPSTAGGSSELFYARVDRSTRSRAIGPISVTPGVDGAVGASAASNGSGFVVARGERISPIAEGIVVRFLDGDGTVTTGPHAAETSGSPGYTSIARAGDTLGVAYQTNTGAEFAIHFVRFDLTGTTIGAALDTTGLGVRPHIAGQSSGWGLIWDGADGLYFAGIAPDGTLAVLPRRISSGGAQGAAIAADGAGGWGVVYRSGVGVEFQRLDASGAEMARAELAGFSVDGLGSLAYDGTRFIAGVFGAGSALWVPCSDL
jgi:hypothetical protein